MHPANKNLEKRYEVYWYNCLPLPLSLTHCFGSSQDPVPLLIEVDQGGLIAGRQVLHG
jgi:hypothetical protein